MSPLANAIFAVLLRLSPLAAPRSSFPGWAETETERAWRYASIATDIAEAATDACGERGPGCRRWAAMWLLAVSWHESGYAPDVESPSGCYRGRDGRSPRCDGDRAATIFQMQGSREERALWLGSRVAAAREALRRINRSWSACHALPEVARLSAYASGRCVLDGMGAKRARELWGARERVTQVWPR